MFLCTSCVTQKLWEKTEVGKYVKIPYAEITEEELKEKDAKYFKNDLKEVYYIEMDSFTRFKNYTLRALVTPLTVTVDTAAVVVVLVAYGAFEGAIDDAKDENCKEDPDCKF